MAGPDGAADKGGGIYMTDQQTFERLKTWFRDDNWRFDTAEEDLMVFTGITGNNGQYQVISQVRDGHLLAFCFSPVNVPADKRQVVADYLTRANYGLLIGNFEMDMSDGEVRYKTSIKFGRYDLETEVIGHMISMTCAMMDCYYPGMISVIYGDVAPEEAIQQIEG
jgi:hypothetical protein